MKKNIHLYGVLAQKVRRKVRLEVASPAEAVRALIVLYPEIEQDIREGSFVLVRRTMESKSGRILKADMANAVRDEDYQVGDDAMSLALGKNDLHIVPVIGGAGGRGVGKVILGVAMVAGAFAFAPAAVATAAGGAAAGAAGGMGATAISLLGMNVTFGTLAAMGVITALGGISQALAKPPKAPEPKESEDSFIFTGATNVGSQNNVVPLVYGGPIRVGSVTISSEITTVRHGQHNGGSFGFGAGNNGLVGGMIRAGQRVMGG